MKDTIAGLELYAVKGKYGVYLKCDCCGATLDAPVENNRISSDENKLMNLARSIDWTGSLDRKSTNDLCPICNKGEYNE